MILIIFSRGKSKAELMEKSNIHSFLPKKYLQTPYINPNKEPEASMSFVYHRR